MCECDSVQILEPWCHTDSSGIMNSDCFMFKAPYLWCWFWVFGDYRSSADLGQRWGCRPWLFTPHEIVLFHLINAVIVDYLLLSLIWAPTFECRRYTHLSLSLSLHSPLFLVNFFSMLPDFISPPLLPSFFLLLLPPSSKACFSPTLPSSISLHCSISVRHSLERLTLSFSVCECVCVCLRVCAWPRALQSLPSTWTETEMDGVCSPHLTLASSHPLFHPSSPLIFLLPLFRAIFHFLILCCSFLYILPSPLPSVLCVSFLFPRVSFFRIHFLYSPSLSKFLFPRLSGLFSCISIIRKVCCSAWQPFISKTIQSGW